MLAAKLMRYIVVYQLLQKLSLIMKIGNISPSYWCEKAEMKARTFKTQ